MKSLVRALAAAVALGIAGGAAAQEKVVLGMSGWTGFQPLKLAELIEREFGGFVRPPMFDD